MSGKIVRREWVNWTGVPGIHRRWKDGWEENADEGKSHHWWLFVGKTSDVESISRIKTFDVLVRMELEACSHVLSFFSQPSKLPFTYPVSPFVHSPFMRSCNNINKQACSESSLDVGAACISHGWSQDKQIEGLVYQTKAAHRQTICVIWFGLNGALVLELKALMFWLKIWRLMN